MHNKRCFYGIEAEGPNRGTPTLFVPGTVLPAHFRKALLAVKHPINSIYYGAGNDCSVNLDTIKVILIEARERSIPVIAEVRSLGPLLALQQFRIRLTIICKDFEASPDLIDYQGSRTDKEIIWTNVENKEEYRTLINDPLFGLDEVIEY